MSQDKPASDDSGKIAGVDKRVVAGIAVGSAAIAAALLFTTRYGKGKGIVVPPEPKAPDRPRTPDASDIEIGKP